MGFYRRHILPRLIDRAMKNREAAAQRRLLLPAAEGRVLEIGVGSGLNLPFYGEGVTGLVGLDPSAELLAMARARQPAAGLEMALIPGSAEALPFESRSFDSLVSTWTLCSIGGAYVALSEMRRVLKPEGRLIFIEHGRAENPKVVAWQDRLNPLWGRIAGGCNVNRPIAKMIRESGFAFESLDRGYLIKGPKFATYHYRGLARPR